MERREPGRGGRVPSLVIAFSLAVLLGAVLLMEGPVPGMWAIGTLVGINMLIGGLSIISIGSAGQGLAIVVYRASPCRSDRAAGRRLGERNAGSCSSRGHGSAHPV